MKKFTASFEKFHNDESGMEALQTVVILAVAALVLAGLYEMWGTDSTGFRGSITTNIKNLINNGSTSTGTGGAGG